MDESLLKVRLEDALWRVERRWQDEVTDFIPKTLAYKMLPFLNASEVLWAMWGGYEEADRVRIALNMVEKPVEPKAFRMQLIRGKGSMRFVQPTHRDYLGALMSLGFVRGKMGDILVVEDGCELFIVDELASFICQSSLRVCGVSLSFSRISLQDWRAPEQKFLEKRVFLNSLRLDAVVAHGFNVPRSEATKRIVSGDVLVSYSETTSPSLTLSEGDVVVVRRLGKIKVGRIEGVTKKHRLCVLLYKYL